MVFAAIYVRPVPYFTGLSRNSVNRRGNKQTDFQDCNTNPARVDGGCLDVSQLLKVLSRKLCVMVRVPG